MIKKSNLVSFGYRGMRTIASKLYYLRFDMLNDEMYKFKRSHLSKHCHIDRNYFRQYKKIWLPWSSSFFLSRSELEVNCFLSHVMTLDYMPGNVFSTTVNPILNNKQMSWGYAEKGNYSKLYGIDNEPLSLFRYLNGLYYDFAGNQIQEPESFLDVQLKEQKKILIKPVIDSRGGRNILVFEKDKNDAWHCVNDQVKLSLKNLIAYYKSNFVVQEYVEQHPFYKRFNPSSFNTVRIYVYRSPSNEEPHVLHSVLKAGKPGSMVDNLKAGGASFYIKPDGTILNGITYNLKKFAHLPNEPEILIENLEKAPGLDAMHDMAKKVALKIPYHRLVAMDVNIDATGKPRLIELNLSETGFGVQLYGFPFFGSFTREVIEYCKAHKKVDFLRI